MNSQEIATVMSTVVSLLAIWLFFAHVYRDYRVDLFRQRMFSLRDELFDVALEGQVPFNHPAYAILRTTMNGHIRFAHRLSLLTVILFALSLRASDYRLLAQESFRCRWAKAAKSVDPASRKRLKDIRQRMDTLVVRQALAASPFLLLLVTPGLLILLLLWFIHVSIQVTIKSLLARFMSEGLDSAALAAGSAV